MSDRSLNDLEPPLRFWSGFLGIAMEELLEPGLRVVPHAGLGNYRGAWIFAYGQTNVLSVPPPLVEELRLAAGALSAETAQNFESIARLLDDRAERVIGPAYHGYLSPESFRPQLRPDVRVLTPDDDPALSRLQEACTDAAWAHAGIDPRRATPAIGVWLDGCLAAVAQNEVLAPGVVSPGVVTHPYFRGRGAGKAAVSAVTADALERGELALYQTLLSNAPALAIAETLGYRPCGTHLAIRFR